MTDLHLKDRFGRGEFADVFALGDGRVCKLYRAAGSARWREWAPKIHEHELRAYELAASDELGGRHTARCFGSLVVSHVQSLKGHDVSTKYLLSTGIVLERLTGDEEKATGLDERAYPHIYRLLEHFDAIGVRAWDASVFGFADPAYSRFIDIITPYGYKVWSEVM